MQLKVPVYYLFPITLYPFPLGVNTSVTWVFIIHRHFLDYS